LPSSTFDVSAYQRIYKGFSVFAEINNLTDEHRAENEYAVTRGAARLDGIPTLRVGTRASMRYPDSWTKFVRVPKLQLRVTGS
jgi:outer membrane receptor protein involved in Fe transport